MAFTYSPIASDELRLFKPLSSGHDGNLSFQVCHRPRIEASRFTAASYTWGAGDATETILLDGLTFYIRRNLLDLLYHLGHTKTAEWDYIWVDAICIDQTNSAERNDQVREMDQTYRRATSVSIWLGPVPESLQENFKCEKAVASLLQREYWSRRWVIQEVLLASKIHVYCGPHNISWGVSGTACKRAENAAP
jgi:hypothetical protein